MRKAFLEIGALFEDHWTGIPNVVAALATDALRDPTIEWSFVYDTIRLPNRLVEQLLASRSGEGGLDRIAELAWEDRTVPPAIAKQAIGIFTNIKPMRNFFGVEAMVAYDLSPLLSSQHHHPDSITHFADRIRADIDSSDHIFCISNAVMNDISYYFGKPMAEMSVIALGVDFDWSHVSAAHLSLRGLSSEPYIVIVGTLEPRKNGRIMLDYLQRDPGFASRYRTVFIGRDGWLDERRQLLEALAGAGVEEGRVVFTGFLAEADKIAIVQNASFCVYPSFFEGYGLPVLEAAALGKVTVCSNSSSIPEVYPQAGVFFDPGSLDEFGEALARAELRAAQTRSSRQALADIMERAEPLSWRRCYSGVARWIHQLP